MDYQTMRTFADSWGLLFMAVVFAGVVLSVFFGPGAKRAAQEAAQIPLKED
ncbi:MAG: cbb3-type cytochrome c oxidase subunit 3 [Notoacmeibacter sp.]|nr:cbb3-type cytochrome c oxidase subunit 3 [Notoacmeibacter sp.]MCC0032880.1 cbb3-type cytochrome c oxidase subunit 3 [Brucellaceae bacterium]